MENQTPLVKKTLTNLESTSEHENRFKKIETKLIEQEHRVLPIIKNIHEHGFDNEKPQERNAAWAAAFSYILRQRTITIIISAISGLGFLVTTYLLWNQNKLIENQNYRIEQQTYLQEAERRSSLNFLLANVLDKVDEELKDPKNKERKLSPELIGRIISLSQSFQPYLFMDGDTMIGKPLSPERGSLLIALLYSKMSDLTLDTIFQQAFFDRSYLRGAVIPSRYMKGISLRHADLRGADIRSSNLEGAHLNGADMTGAHLTKSNLDSANLTGANLEIVELSEVFLTNAELVSAELPMAILDGTILTNTNLNSANLNSCLYLTKQQLLSCKSLIKTRGIPEQILLEIKKNKPGLLE